MGSFVVNKMTVWTPWLGPKSYAFLFTSNRLIGVRIKRFTGRKTRKMVSRVLKKELKKVSFESILKADKDNFEIPYSEITRIGMKKSSLADRYAGTLEIYTLTKKDKFEITSGHDFEQCVEVVRSVLPEKLVIK